MTNAMRNPMTRASVIRMLPPVTPERARRIRARRRRALVNTLLEALTTIGLGVCFILCAVMVMCVA